MTRAEFNARLVAEARSWVGVGFRNNGRTRSQGVDCLGFVLCVYHALGVALPMDGRAYTVEWFLRVLGDPALAELSEAVFTVPPGDLRVGDVLYFRPGLLFRQQAANISHAGLYVGGDAFLQAITNRGICESNLQSRAWRKSLAGAVRLYAVEQMLEQTA